MNIGLFGGTFNPPHVGHLRAAKIFYTEQNLDKLIIMPAFVSPFKTQNQTSVDVKTRLDMVNLCFDSLKTDGINYEISDFEISKNSTSFTIDTVKHIKNLYQNCNLFLYIGSDMLFSFDKWKDFEKIFSLCDIFTLPRSQSDSLVIEEYAQKYKSLYNANIIISKHKDLCVSSTDIRNDFINNQYDITDSLLTESVLRYIIENGLYKNE